MRIGPPVSNGAASATSATTARCGTTIIAIERRAAASPTRARLRQPFGDIPVDLAILKQPPSVPLHHLIAIRPGRAHLWPGFAVLDHAPVRHHGGLVAAL